MVALATDYVPDSGVRSAIIRGGRSLRTALDAFLRDLPGLGSGTDAVKRSVELVQWSGQRSRMLSQQLGMHAWVRTLAVPGRGAPVFILHDEYSSWLDMLRTLVADMAQGGQRELSLAEVGVSSDGDRGLLLREFAGLQYLGVLLEREGAWGMHEAHRRVSEQIGAHGHRAVLHRATSVAAAAALPLHALDVAVVDAAGQPEHVVAQDLQWWESRVKPGGILAGRGFGPGSLAGVQAVCDRRFGSDIHLGLGGAFWWFVEPAE